MDTFLDVIKGIGTLILGVLVIAVIIGALCAAFVPVFILSCNEQTKDIGLPHKYNFWGGCMVQENGNWIPLDNWRYLGNE